MQRRALALVVVVALAGPAAACRHAVLVVDNASKPEGARGTISGTLVTPQDLRPVAGRLVTATENTTGARFTATTNQAGGFTLLVDPGTYRLDVALQPGEGVLEPPTAISVGRGEIKTDVTLTLGTTTRPL